MKECFANKLGGCNAISREHFLSAGILELIIGDGSVLTVGGYTWCPPGKTKNVGKNAFQAHILCEKHNSKLSILDSEAISFFKFLGDIIDSERGKKDSSLISKSLIIKADVFERWLLKFVIGLMASGGTKSGKFDINKNFADEYIEVLFDLKEWPREQGFYIDVTKKVNVSTKCVNSDFNADLRNDKLIAVMMNLFGVPTVLSLCDFIKPAKDLSPDDLVNNLRYRPSSIELNKSNETYKIQFNWPGNYQKGIGVQFAV